MVIGTAGPGWLLALLLALPWVAGCPLWGDAGDLPHGQGDDDTGDDDDTVDVVALDLEVVDAEYHRGSDRLVVVSATPPELHVIDPVGPTVESVALSSAPTCVAIEPTGERALAGHDGSLSLVELASLQVTEEHDLSCAAHDLVAGGNGWAYVFPAAGEWEDIHCVQLASGLEFPHIGSFIYQQTTARLSPNGYAVYGADNGLTPSDLEKYLIDLGPAEYWTDSPYDGEYAIDGDLWIADDGARIFVRAGEVFTAADDPVEDMTHEATLASAPAPLAWVEHSTVAGRVWALEDGDTPSLWSYDGVTLALLGETDLPTFDGLDEDQLPFSYESAPRFAFVSGDGGRLHLLVQAVPAADSVDWGLLTLPVADLP